jgi:flavorubredoxin
MDTKLREGIHWVGYVDWNVRDFHGYRTHSGSTYNSYIVCDEKVAVIDAVKAPYADRLLSNIKSHTPLEKVDYLVVNHAEPDHSGGVPAVMAACPNAVLVCDAKCKKALDRHFDTSAWTFQIVKSGDSLSLGARTLQFIETPMVHWPESMFTYIPEEKILFSMDAFGQHYASGGRFDDEEPFDVILHEAKTYFANIVMLYARPIRNTLKAAGGLDIEMIAPSHGVIWRKNVDKILQAYHDWTHHKPARKVLVVYDTMWRSTELMADAIVEGVQECDVDIRVYNVNASHITELATEVLEASGVAVGSPTLNMTLMPQMACMLTYWKGLRPAEKVGFAFGSYGWSKNGGPTEVESYLKDMKFDLVRPALHVQFVPSEEDLEECREAGRLLAQRAIENHDRLHQQEEK